MDLGREAIVDGHDGNAVLQAAVEQRDALGDVGDVGAGGDDVQWDTCAVADQVVFAAGFAAVDRRRAGTRTPLLASMCEASTAALDQSIIPAALTLSSRYWRWGLPTAKPP